MNNICAAHNVMLVQAGLGDIAIKFIRKMIQDLFSGLGDFIKNLHFSVDKVQDVQKGEYSKGITAKFNYLDDASVQTVHHMMTTLIMPKGIRLKVSTEGDFGIIRLSFSMHLDFSGLKPVRFGMSLKPKKDNIPTVNKAERAIDTKLAQFAASAAIKRQLKASYA